MGPFRAVDQLVQPGCHGRPHLWQPDGQTRERADDHQPLQDPVLGRQALGQHAGGAPSVGEEETDGLDRRAAHQRIRVRRVTDEGVRPLGHLSGDADVSRRLSRRTQGHGAHSLGRC